MNRSEQLYSTDTPWRQRGFELLVCAIILLPSLLYPLARDQGLFSYAGQVILDGGQPYQNVYDQKGPATHYTFALIVAVFGTSTIGIRIFFFVVALVGTQLSAAIGQQLAGRSARSTCAICYALVSLQAHPMGPWMSGQVEDIILPLCLGAVLLLGSRQRVTGLTNICAAAALMGLAFTYKPTIVLPSIAIALVSIAWAAKITTNFTSVMLRVVLSIVAYVTPLALFSGYFVAVGVFDDLWMFVVDHNLNVYAKLQSGSVMDAFRILAAYFAGIAILGACGVGIGRTRQPILWTLLWTLISSSGAMIVWQWKFFILYHWTVFAGSLSIVAGLTLYKVIELLGAARPEPTRRRLAFGVCVVAFFLVPANGVFYARMIFRTASFVGGFESIDEFRSPYRVGSSSAADTYQAAAYVRQRTQSDDTLLVWGYDVTVNYLADRRCPSRFVMNRVLQRNGSPHIERWQQEFIRDITRSEPAYILVADEYNGASFIGNPREHLEQFAALHNFVTNNYELETRIGSFDVYRLRTGSVATKTTST
jgi:hypothetical protein